MRIINFLKADAHNYHIYYLTNDLPLENVTTSLSMAAWRPGGDTHTLSASVVLTTVLSGTCWHGDVQDRLIRTQHNKLYYRKPPNTVKHVLHTDYSNDYI